MGNCDKPDASEGQNGHTICKRLSHGDCSPHLRFDETWPTRQTNSRRSLQVNNNKYHNYQLILINIIRINKLFCSKEWSSKTTDCSPPIHRDKRSTIVIAMSCHVRDLSLSEGLAWTYADSSWWRLSIWNSWRQCGCLNSSVSSVSKIGDGSPYTFLIYLCV